MPYRKGALAEGNYYHVYNRGAGRQPIFFNPGNYTYCLRLVKKYRTRYGMDVIAYCLMPNHYHFLLRPEGQSLSRFVGVLFNAYVQALNRQQGRTGALFEGRFKHVHVDAEDYLVHLCRYIHANPVRAGLVATAAEWPYSNYREWIGTRPGTLVDHEFVDTFFPDRREYATFVNDYACSLEALPEEIETYLFD